MKENKIKNKINKNTPLPQRTSCCEGNQARQELINFPPKAVYFGKTDRNKATSA